MSRRNLLRLRIWTSLGGLALLLTGLLPWSLLVVSWLQASGGWRALLVAGLAVWGLAFLPLLWLGWKVLRLAWRPVRLRVWQRPDVIEGERVGQDPKRPGG